MLRFFLSLFIILNCVCCKSQAKLPQKQVNEAVIEMSKTKCYGKCPVFSIVISSDGNAVYTGEMNVSKVGKFTKHFTAEEMQKLFSAFESADFGSFKDEYPDKSKDMSVISISYTKESKIKKVKGTYRAPKTLKSLVRQIDIIAESEGWKKEE